MTSLDRMLRWCVLAGLMVLPGPQAALAAEPPAAAQGHAIHLVYQLYGRGMHVMNVEADFRLTPDGYSMRLHDQTAGLLSLMLHTNVTSVALGRFGADGGVEPAHFESSGYSRGADRHTVLDYRAGNPVVALLTPPEPKRDPVDPASTRGSIDTLSAIADMVHKVQTTGRCDGQALVFDGLRLTRVVSDTGPREMMLPGARSPFGGPTLRCDFISQQVAGFLHNGEGAQMHEPKHGSAWIARVLPGAPPLPIRITFQNPQLGEATMYLVQASAGGVGTLSG